MRWSDCGRLSVNFVVVNILTWKFLERLHHRITNQVCEGNLATAGALEMRVNNNSIVNQDLGGKLANTGCSWDTQRGIHVGSEGLGHAAQNVYLGLSLFFLANNRH